MKKLVLLSIFLAAGMFPVAAQTKLQPGWIWLEVDGRPTTVSAAATTLTRLPRREVKAKDHDGKENTYSGYELRDVLKLGGAKFGEDLRGQAMAYYLLVEAADNYHAVFALPELDETYTDKIVILADTIDGKPLDAKNGPWQIIVPGEKKHARWVRQVTALKVIKAQLMPTIR